jgi:hypothetical protein
MTKTVAVTTVQARGEAEVLAEALKDAEIPVELKRLGASPYLPVATDGQYEVRVPEDRLKEAEAVLTQLSEDAEVAATRESALAAPPTAAPSGKAFDGRTVAMAVALVLLVALIISIL